MWICDNQTIKVNTLVKEQEGDHKHEEKKSIFLLSLQTGTSVDVVDVPCPTDTRNGMVLINHLNPEIFGSTLKK